MKTLLSFLLLLIGCFYLQTSKAENNDKETTNFSLSLKIDNKDSVAFAAIFNMLAEIQTANQNNKQAKLSEQLDIVALNDTFRIKEVYHYSFFRKRKNAAAIGFDNYFELDNFPLFKKEFLVLDQNDKANLVLFLNGKPLPDIKLQFFNETSGTINFMWERSDSLTKSMIKSYIAKFHFKIKKPSLGFGYYDNQKKQWVQVANKAIGTLDVLKPYAMMLVGLWLLFLIFVFYRLGRKTNLLKTGVDMDSPYSLSLTQFAFWTVIIFSSYFYLWVVDLELDKIPESSLVLLGITAATTATSRVVDLNDTQRTKKRPTKQFFSDLLTEGNKGYSVHRCQLILVTLMFGIFYIFEVVRLQELPDFNGSLLWLIGISSGTFVGLKSVEGFKGIPANTAPVTENAPAQPSEDSIPNNT